MARYESDSACLHISQDGGPEGLSENVYFLNSALRNASSPCSARVPYHMLLPIVPIANVSRTQTALTPERPTIYFTLSTADGTSPASFNVLP